MNHFAMRCVERGITETCPYSLREDLRKAVLGELPREGYVERVIETDHGANIWRFRVREGIFYAVVGCDGVPRTVFTQQILRDKKWARKARKRRMRRGDTRSRK